MAKKNLNEKELVFAHEYVSNGFNGTKAAQKAYDIPDDKIDQARVTAWRLLKEKMVQEAIDVEEGSYRALARGMEMDRKEILKELKRIVWGKHIAITKTGHEVELENAAKDKIAAINTLVKLTGDFSPEKKEIDFTSETGINTKNLSEDEIKSLQATLLNEL